MTAWAQLILHSTLPSGSAWDHLNAQQAGGTGIVVNDGIVAELELSPIDVEIDTGDIDAIVEDAPIEVFIEDAPVYVEVQE